MLCRISPVSRSLYAASLENVATFSWSPIINRSSIVKKRRPPEFQWGSEDDMAFNHVLKKDGRLKPNHTVEEQIAYMASDTFQRTYQGQPIYMWYKRNFKGQWKMQPPPRLRCLDNEGRFNLNNACPVCRDEYLFFHYRNPSLIRMFLQHGSDQPLPIVKTALCREQYIQLQAQTLRAKECGTMPFAVEFRRFNYADWYPDWLPTTDAGAAELLEQNEQQQNVIMNEDERLFWESRNGLTVEAAFPNPTVMFEAHEPDERFAGDHWWIRHARRSKVGRRATQLYYPERFY